MTDNDIIKTLECCNKDDCDNCPNTFGNCYANLAGYALELINRQQAEIERLNENIRVLQYCNEVNISSNAELHDRLRTAKAEAVKEFADRLKEKSWDVPYKTKEAHYVQVVDIGDIEDIEKEMVGDLTMNKLNDKEVLKDFVKRLKEKGYIPKPYGSGKVVDECDIDNLLKEMVGDQNV